MELRRILNKKRVLIIIILILVNGLFFLQSNKKERKYDIYNDLIVRYSSSVEKGEDITIREICNEYEQENGFADEEELPWEYKEAKQLFINKIKYIKNYNQTIEAKKELSNKQKKSQLFKDRYYKLQILKSDNDIKKIENQKVEVSNGIWLEKVADYKTIFYLCAIGTVVIILSFYEDRKKGLIYIQYASKNGRIALLIKRLIILLGFIFFITMIMYIETVLLSLKIYGGYEGLTKSLCSDEKFAMCSHGMSRIKFIAFSAIKTSICSYSWALIIWMILLMFNQKNVGLIAGVVINVAEVLLYNLINSKSIFRIFKYVNIYYLFDSSKAWFKYENWGFSYAVMDTDESTLVMSIIVILILSAILCVKCVIIRPADGLGILDKFFSKIAVFMQKIFAFMPSVFMEMKKILFNQNIIWLILGIVLIVTYKSYGQTLRYSITTSTIKNFCEENSDKSDDELYKISLALKNEKENIEQGIIQKNELEKQILYEKIKAVSYVLERHENNVDVSLASQYEYNSLFGNAQKDNQEELALLCIILALFICSGTISYERKNMTMHQLHSTALRNKWLKSKMLINTVIISLVVLEINVLYYHRVIDLYKITDGNILLQSIRIFENFPVVMSVRTFIALDILLKIIYVNMIGNVGYIISFKFKYEMGYLLSLIFTLPYFAYKMGIGILGYLSWPRYVALIPMWTTGNVKAYLCVAFFGVLLGLFCIYKVNKKWKTTSI